MRKSICKKHGTRKQRGEFYGLQVGTPEYLSKTAAILREEGCDNMEVRAALLALCGVPIKDFRVSPFRWS